MFFQRDGTLKRLVTHSTLEQLTFCGVDILPVGRHSLLRGELSITHVTVVSFIGPLMPQHMVLETVLVLILASTDLALQPFRWGLQMLNLMYEKTL